MSKNKTLTEKQERAIAELLSPRNPTVARAAEAANVSTATIYRWLKEPDFKQTLSDAQGAAIDAAVRNLTALAESAIIVINYTLSNNNIAPGVRLRAAGMALEFLLRLKDSHDFEERLRALENVQNAKISALATHNGNGGVNHE